MIFNNIKKIHIIGIEGAGTSALARILKQIGKIVSGSDEGDHFYFDILKNQNIKIFHKFHPDNIPKDVDLIIYSSAFNAKTNQELKAGLKLNIPVLSYAQALAEFINQKYSIAVCGSHGKTTTTALLGFIMQKAGLDPNVIVGAKVPQFKGNSITGKSKYLVVEVDEYQNKLKHYNPKMILLNNIDYDHPDFFKTKKDYQKTFIDFIKKVPKTNCIIVNSDDFEAKKVVQKNCTAQKIMYGMECKPYRRDHFKQNYIAYNIKQKNSKQCFTIQDNKTKKTDTFCIQLPGKHNIYNALAVIAACKELNIKISDIKKYLKQFKGVNRRMQILGQFNKAIIINDYAHHPSEIKAVLAAARELYKSKKIIAVFHPHTFTRTKVLLNQFAQSFYDANEVIILDIYGSAREKQGNVHSRDLINQLSINNYKLSIKQKNQYIETLDKCEAYLRRNIKPGNVVLLMGAGDVFRIGERIINNQC